MVLVPVNEISGWSLGNLLTWWPSLSLHKFKVHLAKSPLHRENWENGKKKFRQGKHKEFGNFVKTRGISFTQVVNSLMLKVKNIAIFAVQSSRFFLAVAYVCQVGFVYVIVSNLQLDREKTGKTGNLKIQFE